MLKNTFCHIPSIGAKFESLLWRKGLKSWTNLDLLAALDLSARRQNLITKNILESQKALRNQNPYFFAKTLDSNQHWRLFSEFRHKTAYLDIETTGLDKYSSHVTTIALYNGNDIKYYVYGQNLEEFIDDFNRYDMVVTFNGKCFDIPYLENHFDCKFEHIHLDLRHIMKSLGYKGGLKKIEQEVGISRGELEGVDGYTAVLLWQEFVRNDNQSALETLLAYNIEDTVNLEKLMVLAYNMKAKEMLGDILINLDISHYPTCPFVANSAIIEKIRRY